MVAIGLILVVLAAGGGAFLAWLALQSASAVALSGVGVSFSVLPITLLVAGAAAVLLLWVGFRLVGAGFRRKRAQRRELKELRQSGQLGGSAGSTRPGGTTGLGGATRQTGREGSGAREDPAGSGRLDRGPVAGGSSDSGFERKADPRA